MSEDYEEAFAHYQNGVDVLLRGVQGAGEMGKGVSGGCRGAGGSAEVP